MRTTGLCALSCILMSTSVLADYQIGDGIGATASISPYEDVNTEYMPLPLLYLQAGDFYFQGAQFGYSVFEAQQSALEMGVGLDSVN